MPFLPVATNAARPDRRLGIAAVLTTLLSLSVAAAEPAPRPNVVLIYADDLGYGDVSCQGGKIPTPNIDRLAAAGLRFTDAHATSATCTPSRYALLTGEYPWRKKGTGVLPGNARLIIDPDRTTLADVMKSAGYATGVVGKWHLGLGDGNLDWNGEIKPGPLELGFDTCFLVPATGDRVPTVYVDDHRVAGLDPSDPIAVDYSKKIGDEPTGREHPELLKQQLTHGHDMTIVNGISRIGWMTGGKTARWIDEDMADVLTRRATEFVAGHKTTPFFLYYSTHDIHVPRVPHARFRGSEQGLRGDAIRQLDWSVGEVLKSLRENGLAENTLVIFTSDNGPILDDGYADGAVEKVGDHQIGGPLRGNKYSLFEAGTRVPFFARWPARIQPGTSAALICQMDLIVSLGSLVGAKIPDGAAPDAENVLPALLGESRTGRTELVEHANGLTLRSGDWKYIPAAPGRRARGGGAKPYDNAGPDAALYDLSQDVGERENVAGDHPEIVARLDARLKAIERKGRE